MNLTAHGMKARVQDLLRAKATISRMREKGEETVGMALQTVEVTGSAFAWAYANQRYGNGEVKVLGIPADLATGIGLHVIGLFGGVGRYSEHAHNVADGSLASYAARQGAIMGASAKQKSTSTGWQPAGSFVPGQQTGWAPAGAYQPQAA